MITKIKKIENISKEELLASFSKNPVIIPTETVYGITTPINNIKNLYKIYELKNRPLNKPLLILINKLSMLENLIEEDTPEYKPLIDQYWPGPLTLIYKAKKTIPPIITAGTGYVGIRFSSSPVVSHVIDLLGCPIVAPSANLSGMDCCRSAIDAFNVFNGSVELIIDGGYSDVSGGSTVFSYVDKRPKILREGPITKEMISKFFTFKIANSD
ncbi:Threonylcarbamoyl-AMP synthase [Dictyocoela muelleri]|nr:Threonylcarbamoyl-AMP synthase [Dictyocoela muelleri]